MTINGKSIADIFNELSVFVEPTDKTYNGFDYRKIEDFYCRLWDIVGKRNVIITQPKDTKPIYTELPTGQVICSVYIEVSILYDDGSIFRTVGSWGEMELIRSKDGSKFDGIGNIIDTASAKALKLALKKLDMYGTYTHQDDTSSKKTKKPTSTSKNNNEVHENLRLIGMESIVEIRKDNNTRLPVYTWKCKNGSEEANIVFYPNIYTRYDDWMERLKETTKSTPNTLIEVACKKLAEKDGVKQLMFVGK